VLGEGGKHAPRGAVSPGALDVLIDGKKLHDVIRGPEQLSQTAVVRQIDQVELVRGVDRTEDRLRGARHLARAVERVVGPRLLIS